MFFNCLFMSVYLLIYVYVQDFYEDLFEELGKYGEIESLNICDNLADHMVCSLLHIKSFEYLHTKTWKMIYVHNLQVGNVYAQFREEEHAAAALQNLSGRFYAGKFISFMLSYLKTTILLSNIKSKLFFRSTHYCGLFTSHRFS